MVRESSQRSLQRTVDLTGITGGGDGWLSMGNDPSNSQSCSTFLPGNQGLVTQALDDILESEYCELPVEFSSYPSLSEQYTVSLL